jgi:N-acetylglucosaminyldiphosphoundecaprenol N-acetyl-beta-D-mannosaminyltransferase
MNRVRVFNLNIDAISYGMALHHVIELAKLNTPSYVCFVNGHMSIEAYWNLQFSDYVNKASFVLADGIPVALSVRLLHRMKQERIAGMDFMPSILGACAKEGLHVFLFGSTQEVLTVLSQRIQVEHASLKIAGAISPSFGPFTAAEASDYVQQINRSGAHVVLVGLGCPKQETWMAQYSNDIHATLLGVGGAFSVYAGLTRRAPRWMQKFALEWLYRLMQEPRRMWKRYLVTNTLFIGLLMKELLITNLGLKKNQRA